MKILPFAIYGVLIILSGLLSACSPAVVTLPITTPTSVAISATRTQPVQPSATAVKVTPENKNMRTVTLEQKNQPLQLHVGEEFLLNLGGERYQWEIALNAPEVVSRVANAAVLQGAQGIYRANQVGKAILSANGDPLCRQTKPPCGMPSIQFVLEIEVIP